jgi:hypothetical protein
MRYAKIIIQKCQRALLGKESFELALPPAVKRCRRGRVLKRATQEN